MKNISDHCSYKEAVRSDAAKRLGIANTPNEEQLTYMRKLAERIFEPLRNHFGVSIFISSFFRSTALNKAMGGARYSQHMANTCAAIDLDADVYGGITNIQIFDYIKDNLDFDQLIAEGLIEGNNNPAWIHVSLSDVNRKDIKVMKKIKKMTVYYKYDPEKDLDISLYKIQHV